MKILIDGSPLNSADKFRGIGSYTQNLISALVGFDKENHYLEIRNREKLPDADLLIIPYFRLFQLSLPLIIRIPTLVTVHDLTPKKFPQHFPVGLKGEVVWQIQKRLLGRVSGILTDSEVSKKDIINLCRFKNNKIFVVYPVIGEDFKPLKNNDLLRQVREKYHLPDQFVLYVGDCNWNKNLPTLINAVNKLGLTLVLVGKVFVDKNIDLAHPWNRSLKEVLEVSAGRKNIIKVGFIPNDELVSFYNLAACYVQPSFYEGFGLSVVEAMACGCPVISSKGGSLEEIGKDSVFYYSPNETDALAGSIKRLLTDVQLKKNLVKKGLLRSSEFSPLNLVANFKKIYEKVI